MTQDLENPEKIKKKVGRPKITPEKFPEDWKEKVLELYAQGKPDVSIRIYLDINEDTFERLLKEDEEFSRLITRGRELSFEWWSNAGVTGMFTGSKGFTHQVWALNMANRFGYTTQKTQVTGANGGPIETKQILDDTQSAVFSDILKKYAAATDQKASDS